MRRALLVLMAALAVSACSGKDRDIRMRDLRSFTNGPDEFMVLPSKELQAPTDYASLPEPTPGGTNLTDQNPLGDGIAALGGKPSALVAAPGVPTADAAMVSYVGRNGVSAEIRETLRVEDEEYRRHNSRFTKLKIVKMDRYNRAYRKQAIDPHVEVLRWRRFGVQVPSSPPAN